MARAACSLHGHLSLGPPKESDTCLALIPVGDCWICKAGRLLKLPWMMHCSSRSNGPELQIGPLVLTYVKLRVSSIVPDLIYLLDVGSKTNIYIIQIWFPNIPTQYRAPGKSMYFMLSRTQAGPGRTVKQEQEGISRNHVQTFSGCSVQSWEKVLANLAKQHPGRARQKS